MTPPTKATTPYAAAIWSGVARAAQGVPEWVRPQIRKAAQAWVARMKKGGPP